MWEGLDKHAVFMEFPPFFGVNTWASSRDAVVIFVICLTNFRSSTFSFCISLGVLFGFDFLRRRARANFSRLCSNFSCSESRCKGTTSATNVSLKIFIFSRKFSPPCYSCYSVTVVTVEIRVVQGAKVKSILYIYIYIYINIDLFSPFCNTPKRTVTTVTTVTKSRNHKKINRLANSLIFQDSPPYPENGQKSPRKTLKLPQIPSILPSGKVLF